MNLVNKTAYRTEDIRRFIEAAHEATGTPLPDHKTVRVTWSRHNRHWGSAYYNNSEMLLTIPKGNLDMTRLCRVTEHELAHNRGIMHGEMEASIHWGTGYAFPEWAKGIELRLVEAKAAPTMTERVAARAAHAGKMLLLWEKKLRTAKRQATKWGEKVRYYDTRPPVMERKASERPPKVVDPLEVNIVLRGQPAGEFGCLITDMASETDDVDRRVMGEWLGEVGTRSGYRFRVMAETLPHVLTLESELTYWQHHNEVTGRSFPRILAKVIAARKAFQAKEPKSTPTEG